jgi:hypothetical protein
LKITTYQNWFRVLFHLNGESVLQLSTEEGVQCPVGYWHVPINTLPPDCRTVGTLVLIDWDALHPESTDDIDEIRVALRRSLRVIGRRGG